MISPAKSRAEIVDLYAATQKLIGGKWGSPDHDWEQCTTESGDQRGVSFDFFAQRLDQAVSDPLALAKQVRSLWAERGYKATISEDKTLTPVNYYLSDPPFLTGTSPDGFLIQATFSTRYADFSGSGRCVAGDLEKLNLSE